MWSFSGIEMLSGWATSEYQFGDLTCFCDIWCLSLGTILERIHAMWEEIATFILSSGIKKFLNIKQQKVSGNILIIASVTTWMSTLRKLTSFLILFYYYYLQFTYNNRWMWFNTNSKTSSFWAEKSCRPLLNMLSQPVTKLLSIDTILS